MTPILKYFNNVAFLYQATATLATFVILRLGRFYYVRKRRFNLLKQFNIPGPEPSLIDGSLLTFVRAGDNHKVEQEFRRRYGKIYGYFIGDVPNIIICDPSLIRKVFFEKISSFKIREHLFIKTPLSHGILFTTFDRWKVMRKVMSPPFSRYNVRGSRSTQFIEDSLARAISYIDAKISEHANQSVDIDILEVMKSTTLHLISQMAIKLRGVEVGENERHVKCLDQFLEGADKGVLLFAIMFPFVNPILQFLADHTEYNAVLKKTHRELDVHINKRLKELSEGRSDGDLLNEDQITLIDTLIKLHHEGKLTREEIIGNADTILLAGYDTTSTTLTYVLWVLARYADVQTRLRGELSAYGVESKYLDQVLNETMRLCPTVVSIVGRLATETVDLGPVTIPQGARVVFNAKLMHLDPEIWPDPERFDPDRFKDGLPDDPCVYAPFGMGDRKCLGYTLAQLQMKMIICDIILRYELRLVAPQSLETTSYAVSLSKPRDRVIINFGRL